jgi:tRNA G18 (ribose-2'-O)-methylase SpoU
MYGYKGYVKEKRKINTGTRSCFPKTEDRLKRDTLDSKKAIPAGRKYWQEGWICAKVDVEGTYFKRQYGELFKEEMMKPVLKKIYTENNDFQHIEVIKRNREKRTKFGEFFVEGVKAINYAIEYNWKISTFVYSAEKPLSRWAADILENSRADVHLEIPLKLMEKLSDKEEEFSEIIAMVSMPKNDLSRIRTGTDMLVIVFDRPSSHGNLGTLIRSCEALKVDGIIVTGHAVDIFDPKVIRASMGTFFALPVIRLESHKELLPWFDSMRRELGNIQIVGSTAKTENSIDEVNLARPMALLLGNETSGLSSNYKEICDTLVKIPMYGKITSFNVSCAASIILYEIDRQQRSL